MTRLVLGDDHSVFLDAMSTVLRQRGFQVTVARTVPGTIESVRRQQPDVCLIDRHFAADNGITAIGPILAASRRTRILVLSADPDIEGVQQALRAGAAGYLHKTRGVSALTRAIERVQRGEVVIDVPKPAPPRDLGRPGDAHRLAAFLTTRERDCLVLLVEGLDTAGIAAKLGVSAATVRTHVQSVLTKLGVHSRLEAASYAVRHRLIDGGGFPPSGMGLRGRPARGRRLVTPPCAWLTRPEGVALTWPTRTRRPRPSRLRTGTRTACAGGCTRTSCTGSRGNW